MFERALLVDLVNASMISSTATKPTAHDSDFAPTSQPGSNDARPSTSAPGLNSYSPFSDLVGKVGKRGTVRKLAFILANDLCNQLGCEQVAVATTSSSRSRLIAISGSPQFKTGSPGAVAIAQAMDECLDQNEAIRFPPTAHTAIFPIHRAWSQSTGGSHVYSVPLRSADEIIAVASFRRSADTPFSDQDSERIDEIVAPYGTLFSWVERANRPVSSQAIAGLRNWVTRRRSPLRWLSTVALASMLAWCMFGSMTFRPMCESSVVASDLQHLTAPFESKLERIHVQAGDNVTVGDALVDFETRPLMLELATIHAEIARTQVSTRAAIASGDASTAALHQAHVKVLTTKKRSLERRIDNAGMTAPADGTIVQSDVDNRLGQVFAQGDPILQFAPDDGWTLLVYLPEDVASYVAPGDSGVFISAARPRERLVFEIEAINGSAEIVDQRNVVVAKARLQCNTAWMRTGMKGVARVKTRPMPPWWIAFHNVIDWARMRFLI